MTTPNPGDLRVWWIPQVPGTAFIVKVPDVATARLVCDALAMYDAFQYEQGVKGEYFNAGGVETYEAPQGDEPYGWCDAYDDDDEPVWQ